MHKLSYWEQIRDLKPDEPLRIQLTEQYNWERVKRASRKKLELGVLDLLKPVRCVNRSKLEDLSVSQLIKIGEADRAHNNTLKEGGFHTYKHRIIQYIKQGYRNLAVSGLMSQKTQNMGTGQS